MDGHKEEFVQTKKTELAARKRLATLQLQGLCVSSRALAPAAALPALSSQQNAVVQQLWAELLQRRQLREDGEVDPAGHEGGWKCTFVTGSQAAANH